MWLAFGDAPARSLPSTRLNARDHNQEGGSCTHTEPFLRRPPLLLGYLPKATVRETRRTQVIPGPGKAPPIASRVTGSLV